MCGEIHRDAARWDTTQECVATCRLESRRYVTPAFQPAGWETFLSPVREISKMRPTSDGLFEERV